MLENRTNLTAFRGFMMAVCLAFISGCGPGTPVAPAGSGSPGTSVTPAVPANVAATAGNATVTLTWTASSGATTYNVKRATTSGGPYTQLANPSSAGYTDSSVTNGTAYYYVVSALSAAGESANSAQVSAIPVAAPGAPTAPTGLTATAGNAQVSLTWTASSGATSYNVKRATIAGGPYTQLANPSSAGYTDSSVTNGTAYYYVVSALNAAGESANSAQASATPVAAPTAPPAPTGLTATAGNAQVSLTWTASSGATSYHLKRASVSGGPYTQIAAPTSTSYSDTSVNNGTTYYYVVSAVNAIGESANSAQVSATPTVPASTGTWINVTPSNVDLVGSLSCGNFGTQSVQVDPAHPSNLYAEFHCQGVWRSTDYGASWTGPINTGTNGSTVSDCAGAITISPTSTASAPTIYESCIRGTGTGFWKSVDGGVNWTTYVITPTPSRQDSYAPVVDPYDQNHLLMTGHEHNSIVQSIDGGQTWTAVAMAAGMMTASGTGYIYFINTGNSSSTRGTWLWIAGISGGVYGTWRTTDGGTTWVEVDRNEVPGPAQIYQPDNGGVVFMAGTGSTLGAGVLRSTDFGQTWSHVGLNQNEGVVTGTSKDVYAGYGAPVGAGGTVDPAFEVATQPGTGTWVAPGTPAALFQGPAQFAVTNDGTHNILLGAMWNAGLWRYIEP